MIRKKKNWPGISDGEIIRKDQREVGDTREEGSRSSGRKEE